MQILAHSYLSVVSVNDCTTFSSSSSLSNWLLSMVITIVTHHGFQEWPLSSSFSQVCSSSLWRRWFHRCCVDVTRRRQSTEKWVQRTHQQSRHPTKASIQPHNPPGVSGISNGSCMGLRFSLHGFVHIWRTKVSPGNRDEHIWWLGGAAFADKDTIWQFQTNCFVFFIRRINQRCYMGWSLAYWHGWCVWLLYINMGMPIERAKQIHNRSETVHRYVL